MEDILNSKTIAEHFGYFVMASKRAYWKNEPGVLEKIRLLPEVLSEDKKFRVIIDYDPEFSRVLVQVYEVKEGNTAEITIKGEAKEIAALVIAAQEQRLANSTGPAGSTEGSKERMIAVLEDRLQKLKNNQSLP